jgi:protein SCO1/2
VELARVAWARVALVLALLAPLGACSIVPSAPPPARTGYGATQDHVSLFRYPWIWTDEQGKSMTFARWQGEPVVVAVMFTSCRKTCPQTLRTLRKVYATFSRERPSAQFLLVTLDPATDTPERLRQFKQSEGLPETWHLLTGTETQTRDLTDVLDIHVMDLDPHLVHEGKIVVFDRRGMPERSFSSSGVETPAL